MSWAAGHLYQDLECHSILAVCDSAVYRATAAVVNGIADRERHHRLSHAASHVEKESGGNRLLSTAACAFLHSRCPCEKASGRELPVKGTENDTDNGIYAFPVTLIIVRGAVEWQVNRDDIIRDLPDARVLQIPGCVH